MQYFKERTSGFYLLEVDIPTAFFPPLSASKFAHWRVFLRIDLHKTFIQRSDRTFLKFFKSLQKYIWPEGVGIIHHKRGHKGGVLHTILIHA